MSKRATRWGMFILRWAIAVAGIWWVVANLNWRDRVWVLDEQNIPHETTLRQPGKEDDSSFAIWDGQTGRPLIVPRRSLVNRPDPKLRSVKIVKDDQREQVPVLGVDLSDDLRSVRRVLIRDPDTRQGLWISPNQIEGGYPLRVPQPRVEPGLSSMLKLADASLLWAAVLVFPVVFVITAYRWNELLRALHVQLPQTRTFVLNMVGAFYNTFIPGSTGGDVLKAYYASRQTTHKIRAVVSVIVDRIIGLMGLVILGGVMAMYQYAESRSAGDSAALACLRVAVGSVVIVVGTLSFVLVFSSSSLRRMLGLNWLISRLPGQRHVQHVIDVARMYRRKIGVLLLALLLTFPVHIIVVLSAMLAGKAFGLPLPAGYYFVVVPVVVLAGAVPISFQGAGVMEFFAITLTRQYGTTVSQAFALTMSIRLVQVFWNLLGGIFVFRGGYHAPSAAEQAELDQDEDDPPVAPAPTEDSGLGVQGSPG